MRCIAVLCSGVKDELMVTYLLGFLFEEEKEEDGSPWTNFSTSSAARNPKIPAGQNLKKCADCETVRTNNVEKMPPTRAML